MIGSVHKLAGPGRILLVDDNKWGLSVRKVVLEEQGYRVTDVCCSLKAVEAFNPEAFDLIVTDYRMPHLDGIELIRRMRQQSPQIPIVLISSVAEALGLSEHNTGADAVIQKNSHEISTLTRTVNRLLARKPSRKPPQAQRSAGRRSAAAGG